MDSGSAGARSGLRLGRVLGVPVYLRPSWFLFAAFLVLSYGPRLASGGAGGGYAAAAAFAVLLLASVLLHEIGHCVVARAFGLPVRSITVTFLAGVTDIAEPPQTPFREYAVAVVGPLVSLLLAAVGVAAVPLFPDPSLGRSVCEVVAVINGAVAAFNLLPGLPLDGGRVLRAAVWRVTGSPVHGSVASARAGQVLAVLLLPASVLALPALGGAPSLPGLLLAGLVSAFLFTGATAGLQSARRGERLPDVRAGGLARPALRVAGDVPLAEAVRRAHVAARHAVVVVDAADRAEAVVSEAAVSAVPEERRPWVTAGSVARPLEAGLHLHPELAGQELLAAMQATPATEYLVVDPHTGEERVLVASDVAVVLSGSR